MAQVTITYFQSVNSKLRRDFSSRVFGAVGKALYKKAIKDLQVADVTIRVFQLDESASTSSVGIELHIEVASGEWPKDNNGHDLSRATAEFHMQHLAKEVFALLINHEPTSKGLSVWCTEYSATGWSTSVK